MAAGKTLTLDVKRRIRNMLKAGVSVPVIAERLALADTTVYRVRDEALGPPQEATIHDEFGPCQP